MLIDVVGVGLYRIFVVFRDIGIFALVPGIFAKLSRIFAHVLALRSLCAEGRIDAASKHTVCVAELVRATRAAFFVPDRSICSRLQHRLQRQHIENKTREKVRYTLNAAPARGTFANIRALRTPVQP